MSMTEGPKAQGKLAMCLRVMNLGLNPDVPTLRRLEAIFFIQNLILTACDWCLW